MGYTYEQLKQMGATPGTTTTPAPTPTPAKKGYSYEELVRAGATPGESAKSYQAPFQYSKDDSKIKTNLKTFGNVLPSSWEAVKGIGSIVAHPINTAKGLGSMAAGAVEKIIPGEQKHEQSFDAVVDFYKERYGSMEGFKEALVEDPAGILLDVSTLFTGGGAAVTKIGGLSKVNQATRAAKVLAISAAKDALKNTVKGSPEAVKAANALKVAKNSSNIGEANALTKAGGALSKAGDITNPVLQGTKLFGKGVSAITEGKRIGGKKYTPDNVAAAENIGVASEDLPIFAKTTSPISTTAEAVASKGIGGGHIWQRMNNVYTQMNNTVSELLKGKLDASVLGGRLADAADTFKSKFYDQKNKLYKEAIIPKPKSIPDEIPGFENVKKFTLAKEDPAFANWNKKKLPDGKIQYTKPTEKLFKGGDKDLMLANTVKTRKLLQGLIEREKQALKGYGKKSSPELQTYQGLEKGLGGKSLSTSDVYRTLQKIEGDIKFGTTVKTGNNAKLALIRDTLDAEFLATLKRQRPDLAEALDAADTFYREGIKKINSSIVQAIVKNADKPDLIVKTLLPKLKSIEDVKLLVEVLGQKNMGELRKSIMSEIFTEAKGVSKEHLQPLGISKQIKKFGEDKLEILLNPDQLQAVHDLDQISKMMGKSSKITGGSQTSFNLLSTVGGSSIFTSLTLLFMGNPSGAILSLSPLMGTIAASKFINSSFGRRLMAEGVELSGKTGAKIQRVSKPLGTAAQVGNQLNNVYNSK